jgi:hypothetical protein
VKIPAESVHEFFQYCIIDNFLINIADSLNPGKGGKPLGAIIPVKYQNKNPGV